MKKFLLIFAAVILVVAIVVPRFYHLGSQPPGLHIDEVSFAADAKAIAETGRDTWNVSFPRVFKAFGEWKAPGLTYSMAFWTKVTGHMNNFVARLPSAIAGIASIIFLILTIREIYPSVSPYVLLLIALVMAFSPWHFDMSRIFYEAFSAMSWFALSLYFATRRLLRPNKVKKYEWVGLIASAAIAGYYYASIRYVVIVYVLVVGFLMESKSKARVKTMGLVLIVLLLVGTGWVIDLFSNVGLNRLHYYQQKANIGNTLEIDEKRQFCYLSLNRNASQANYCYFLWNKPVVRVTGAIQTVMTYLGTDFLFVKGESEFGFDSQYGSYLPPILLFYLIGLFMVGKGTVHYIASLLKKGDKSNSFDKVYALYTVSAVLSLVPAAAALNLNMRMAMESLYIVGIVSAIGFIEFVSWGRSKLKPLLQWVVFGSIAGLLAFYIVQSTIHYFFVFTHSNDVQWTSDAGDIFGYVKSVSPNYDRIIDTELHGPLAPYFYGDISTHDVQHGEHSTPDDLGFTYLTKAGKYELRHINILDLACEVVSHSDRRKTLVITNPYPALESLRKYSSRSWSQALLLHEVYDLNDVIEYMKRQDVNFMSRCGPK